MTDIIISPVDDSYVKVLCSEEYVERDIADTFSFKVDNFQRQGKRKYWDGTIRLFDRRRKLIYKGLVFEIYKLAKKRGFTIDIDKSLMPSNDITLEDVKSLIDEIAPHSGGNKITPYGFQYEGVYNMLKSDRSISLAATSSGKSLMIYLALRIYQLTPDMNNKHMFLIVPNKMLVEQMYEDFEDYSSADGSWNTERFVQRINSDYDKYVSKQIIITTWQSLKLIPNEFIRNAGAIFVDEVHGVKGNVLKKLIESARNCNVRHGLTGTLDGMECNELQAQGLFGPKRVLVTAKENIDASRATPVDINCMILHYDENTKRRYANYLSMEERVAQKYNREIEFINNLQTRIDFIQKLALALEGNTIILFDRVEGYGRVLYNDMIERGHENTYIIEGSVKTEEREAIKKRLEKTDNNIVYATTKLMSTGVSIKNLHNIIMVASSKSVIQVLQTLGRLMRKHDSKEVAKVYDLVDRIDYKGKDNYTLKHVQERVKFYTDEQHPVKFTKISLKETYTENENNLF